jgi:hypothetical protein
VGKTPLEAPELKDGYAVQDLETTGKSTYKVKLNKLVSYSCS